MTGMERYKYYSTQRPLDVGSYPKPADNSPVEFNTFVPDRQPVENGVFMAWGYLVYTTPLTSEDMRRYELRPSRENLDVRLVMDVQAQAVGAWEERIHMPDEKRVTVRTLDKSRFLAKDTVLPEKLARQFEFAVEFPNGPLHHSKKRDTPQKER